MHARVAGISMLIAAAVSGGLFLLLFLSFDSYQLPTVAFADREVGKEEERESFRLIFIGDVMLARDVERRLLAETPGYALSAIKDDIQADMVVANFESSVPEVHEPTANMEMRFSVRPELLRELSLSGVTYASLANNHALDYGESGYAYTKEALIDNGVQPAGHPVQVSPDSLFIEKTGTRQVVIVNINATYGYPEAADIVGVLPEDLDEEDLLVTYIHWGEEYELVHSEAQETFAHQLIDSGFDLIVGHHPHVVQDIESYGQGLIFYSLGNFIFDQYWRPEVRQGLLLDLTEASAGWRISLLPVESETAHVQPRLMEGEKKENFLLELSQRSSWPDIANGELLLQF